MDQHIGPSNISCGGLAGHDNWPFQLKICVDSCGRVISIVAGCAFLSGLVGAVVMKFVDEPCNFNRAFVVQIP
jgi:hypothetical protein